MIVSGQYPEFSAHFGADAAGNGDIVQRYMTWAPENPVSIRTSVRGGARGRAFDPRGAGARDLAGDQRALSLVRERGSRRACTSTIATRCTATSAAARSCVSASCAARCCTTSRWTSCGWACMLERIGQTARIAGHAPPHPGRRRRAADAAADRALAVAAARLLRLRGVHAPRAGPRQPRGRRVVPAVRGALPALAALLRPVGAGARPAASTTSTRAARVR